MIVKRRRCVEKNELQCSASEKINSTNKRNCLQLSLWAWFFFRRWFVAVENKVSANFGGFFLRHTHKLMARSRCVGRKFATHRKSSIGLPTSSPIPIIFVKNCVYEPLPGIPIYRLPERTGNDWTFLEYILDTNEIIKNIPFDISWESSFFTFVVY